MIREAEAWRDWPLPKSTTSLRRWQAGRCAWCGFDGARLVRDHCHITGLIRGLLCHGCNQHEGYTPQWDAWSKRGDHAANAIRHFEVYTNHLGQTPLWPTSTLIYYTGDEQDQWWQEAERAYVAGGDWPTTAPWTEAATERREAEKAATAAAFKRLDDLLDLSKNWGAA